MPGPVPDQKRLECANYALHAYGTAYIFERRSAGIQNKIKLLSFLGVAGPASVGAIVGTYNLSADELAIVLFVAGSIAIGQLIISVWSLVSGWEKNLSEYIELKTRNYEISDSYEKLCKEPSIDVDEFQRRLDKLDIARSFIRGSTDKHSISDKEKRRGMRYALRKFQRACAGCSVKPTDMKSTKCGVCGSF